LRWFGLEAAPLDEPIVTDRPDFTESSVTVPYGHLQLEGGYTFTYDRESDTRNRTHTAPEFLLRIGVVDHFELRVGWEGYAWNDNHTIERNDAGRSVRVDDWSQGASDLELGFKLELTEQDGLLPSSAFLFGMTVPTGSARISSGDVDPQAGWLWSYDLSERLALAGQFLLGMPTEGDARFVQGAASISLGIALSERWGAYLEYYSIFPNSKDTDAAHVADGGLTFAINDNLQLDWRAGVGLNEEADDFFTGIGFAWRY
jgi:hypothetical protein